MSGISIPISGDLGPLEATIRELTAEIRGLSATITKAFAPAAAGARKVTRETDQMARSARRSRGSFLQVAQGVTAVGANVAQIAIGVRHFKNLKAGASQAAAGIRKMAANPALKKVMIGAAAAATAIIGTVVVVKTLRAGMRLLGRTGTAVFRGIAAVGKAAFNGVRAAARGLTRIITGGGLMGGMLRLAGVAGVLALATSQLKGAFNAATGFEDLRVSMEQFTGDAEKARGLIDEMTDFSTRTPFETKDVLGASAKLLSSGITGDIGELTRDIAAVAKDGQQLGELADAVAKGFAKGKFQTEELNKFLERGINLMPELAAVTGLTGDELKKAIEAGLSFDQVTAALSRLSQEGGQFFGLLERRSKTTTGLVSTLKSVWDEVRRAFAQPILDALKPVLTGAIDRLNALRAKAAEVGAAIRDIFLGAFVLIQNGRALDVLRVGFRVAVAGAVDLLMRGLRSAVAFLATAVPPIFDAAISKLRDPNFWNGVGLLLQGAAQSMAAELNAGLGRTETADMQRAGAKLSLSTGRNLIGAAGEGKDFSTILSTALADGLQAAAKAGLGPSSPGFREATEAWQALMREAADGVAALRESTAVPGVAPGATGESAGARIEGVTGGGGAPGSFSLGSSLTRIGGGGLGGMVTPMVSQQQQTNRLLGGIKRAVEKPSGTALTFAPA